ncbi:MAG: CCA tRNA nucleotidyltransferase [Clostridia bacterium]|nr:CCA tRNA nucleotidyltransferase [Clostridia bacterium]
MNIPDYITSVLNILYSHGFEGYLVGGCVRDALMGKTAHDFDLTTDATPEEMLEVFKDHRIIETGLKHGTVTVVSGGENVEITTYRIDGAYLDNRRPSDVTFTRNLREDLSRRDFTVNALAYSTQSGLVDCFDGLSDLKAGVIRCVGNPDTRFGEDGLRIMRALRFSAVLGFDIDHSTAKSIISNKLLLRNISSERIFAELKKLVCGQKAASVISEYSEVFFSLFESVAHNKEMFCKNATTLSLVPNDHCARLAALLWGFDDSSVTSFMHSLKSDNHTHNTVRTLCSYYPQKLSYDKYFIRRLMSEIDDELIRALADINSVHHADFDRRMFLEQYSAQKALNPCVKLSQLAVTGSDIISFGVPKGPKVGEIMQKILYAVIDDECANTFDDIKKYCMIIYNS